MEWISVNDRKPQIGQKILVVQNPKTTATKEALFAEWDGNDFKPPTPTMLNGASIDSRWVDIIYWMPLPKPPKSA